MPFNGSGTFQRVHSWTADRSNGIKVRSDRADAEDDGFAAGLSNCIARDGQSTITADIPFNNKKITALADATGDAHALNRQTADGRYSRNANDLPNETAFAVDDEISFWDASANANKAMTYSALRALLGFPTGTKMLFQQTAAPTGWTKDTTHNNKALRIVNGTASTGGTTAFTTVFGARTLTQANLPSYTLPTTLGHNIALSGDTTLIRRSGGNTVGGPGGGGGLSDILRATDTTTLGITGGITGSVTSGGSGTALDFAVEYVDVIIATKD